MKLAHLAMVSTGVVVVLGLVMVISAFTLHKEVDQRIPVLLAFSVVGNDSGTATAWCKDLSAMLVQQQVKAAVFVTGKVAQSSPSCVSSFPSGIDIGSQTYSYSNLTAISDYAAALEEVKSGKQAVDRAGNLDSKLFRAPYDATDENIYSLLTKSGILADFSYKSQYNRYENNQFVKYDLKSLEGDSQGLKLFSLISGGSDRTPQMTLVPVTINFDSSMPVEKIEKFVSDLKSGYGDSIHFVNASDLAGMSLTVRSGEGGTS
jgi:hypothetical protein